MRKSDAYAVVSHIMALPPAKQKLLCSFCKALALAEEDEAEGLFRLYSLFYKHNYRDKTEPQED